MSPEDYKKVRTIVSRKGAEDEFLAEKGEVMNQLCLKTVQDFKQKYGMK
jgi:hypothetical protein